MTRWTWSQSDNPRVDIVLSKALEDAKWCDDIETAADAITGKMLSVCAAEAIARNAFPLPEGSTAARALDLLVEWIDGPTDERFDLICNWIFSDNHPSPDPDPHGLVSWALRTATSSVGNYEAGWALSSLYSHAIEAGLEPDIVVSLAINAIRERQA